MLLLISVFMLTFHAAISEATTKNSALNQNVLCDLGCDCQDFEILDCSGNGISKLPISLQLNSEVTTIKFHGNHLEMLQMDTFSRADNVTELDLSSNLLGSIQNFTFAPFSSLMHLKLSSNKLPELLPGLLEGLFELRYLDMSHNHIQRISYLTFESTQKLQELRLQYNPLLELPENVFRYLTNLEKLDLQDTGLVVLPENLFHPTPHLHWLSLSTNAFEFVPKAALSRAPKLEILNLSENDFVTLVDGSFKRLSNIAVLYLNNLNRLVRIEKDAFAGLKNLKILSCSYNKRLSYVDQHIFGSDSSTKTPPREQLYFRQNSLRTLKSLLEEGSWSELGFVDLAENPWQCDCNLLWMTELGLEAQTSISCATPRRLQGRTFNTIAPEELRCDSNWALATIALIVACIVAFGAVTLTVSAVVCSRTRVGLYVRAKKQFSYDKVKPRTESVDLEWDPSADM